MIRRHIARWGIFTVGLVVFAVLSDAAPRTDLPTRAAEPAVGGATPQLTAHGRVLDPDGMPVSGVVVRCLRVLLPGHTFAQPRDELAVTTDADGRFSFPPFFPVAGQTLRTPGEASVPSPPFAPGARYQLELHPPEDNPRLFPTSALALNTESVDIVLPRPERHHHFFVETEPNQWSRGPELPRRLSIHYESEDGTGRGLRVSFPISKEVLERGGPYQAGRYRVVNRKGVNIDFTLGPATPDTVRIPLPPTPTLDGRVVDGVTGEPLALAAVLAFSGGGLEDLNLPAVFDDAFWLAVGSQAPGTAVDPAVTETLLKKRFTGARLAPAGPDGSFTLTDARTDPAWGVLLLAPGKLPTLHTLAGRRRNAAGQSVARIDLATTPLFPAAFATVRPEFPAPSVRGRLHHAQLRWEVADDATPEGWRHPVPPTIGKWNGVAYTEGWIDGGRTHRVFVPGGVSIRLWVDNSDDALGCDRARQTLRIPPGATHDLGVIRFNPLPLLKVRVVGPEGKPLDGVPLRAKDMDSGVWQVAHLTSGGGWLTVPVNPRTGTTVRIDDVGRNAPRITIPAQTDPADWPNPVLRLNAQQLASLRSNTD